MRGRRHPRAGGADLAQIVREVADFIDAVVRERGQVMTINDPSLPLKASVDISRVRQLLINILSNAP